MGPLSIAIFLVFAALAIPVATVPLKYERAIVQFLSPIVFCAFVVAVPAASTVRSYFRDLDTMKLQLLSISVDSTRSSCCDLHHVGPSGERMMCDRKIVKECVKIWFGSEVTFEDTVRTNVLDILNRDLTQKVFSAPWALGVTSPIMLAFMDVSASWAQHYWVPWEHPAIALLLEGLVIWFIFVPANKDLLILLLRLGRRRPRSTCLELLKNLAVLGAAAVPCLVLVVAYGLTRFADLALFDALNAMNRALAFVFCTLLISLCNFLIGLGLKAFLRRPGW